MKKKGRIFVVSAPSGSGKTTICTRVLARIKSLASAVSATTRPPRRGEKNRKDYHYISPGSFRKKIKAKGFLEWEKNFDYYYGTPKRFVLGKLKKQKDVLLSIDVKGAMHIKKKFPESVLIFIKPPSMNELSRRLKTRNTDPNTEITKRLKIAKRELAFMSRYDHVVVNDNLRKAVNKVIDIIKKEGRL